MPIDIQHFASLVLFVFYKPLRKKYICLLVFYIFANNLQFLYLEMIQELKIKNFLSFKDEVVFSFEATSDKTLEDYYVYKLENGVRLLKLCMVYGANASGKSNLIKVFKFLKDFVSRIPSSKEEKIPFEAFAFNDAQNEPGKLELTFYIENVKHVYILELTSDIILKENLYFYPGTQPAVIFERHFDNEKNISIIRFGKKIKLSKTTREQLVLKTLKNSSVFAAYLQVNIYEPYMKEAYQWFDNKFIEPVFPDDILQDKLKNRLTDINYKPFVIELLKKADFNIDDIVIKEKETPFSDEKLKFMYGKTKEQLEKEGVENTSVLTPQTFFKHRFVRNGKEYYKDLSLEQQSEGTKRYYKLAFPLFDCLTEEAFLAIDEIESSLHPVLIKHLLKEFLERSTASQLIVTTHNISLLNEKDILRKDAIWFTEKGEDGATELFSVADFPEFRKELSYYNYYKSGKFGAVPNIE